MQSSSFQRTLLTAAAALLASSSAWAQSPLSLDDAVARAVKNNPAVRSAQAAQDGMSARKDEARAAYLPKVDISEAWMRGNQPVFVFGSLLGQRQFSAANFDIAALNHPDPLTNTRTAINVEQVIYEGGAVRAGMKMAGLGAEMAAAGRADLASALRLMATQAYGGALIAASGRRAADSAVASAEEDLRRVEHQRDAGLASEADVLSLKVHVAAMRQRAASAKADETVARMRLNEAMGEPIDDVFTLQMPPLPTAAPQRSAQALDERPDVIRAGLQTQFAEAQLSSARSGFLPQAGFQGTYEFNGSTLGNQVSAWTVGVQFKWNVFAGMGDAAKKREAEAAILRAKADRDQATAHARVEMGEAVARLEAAQTRETLARAVQAQARESQRIVKDRYEAGLAGVNDLLRAAAAVLDADVQATASLVDIFVTRAQFERAQGR